MRERALGFDFGMARIGVAAGGGHGGGQAVCTLRARHGKPNWREIDALIAEWKPAVLVVGLPLHMHGGESAMSARAREFGDEARRRFGLRIEFVDERLSTRAAEDLLSESAPPRKSLRARRRKFRDSLAAELLLRAYFHSARA